MNTWEFHTSRVQIVEELQCLLEVRASGQLSALEGNCLAALAAQHQQLNTNRGPTVHSGLT